MTKFAVGDVVKIPGSGRAIVLCIDLARQYAWVDNDSISPMTYTISALQKVPVFHQTIAINGYTYLVEQIGEDAPTLSKV